MDNKTKNKKDCLQIIIHDNSKYTIKINVNNVYFKDSSVFR